MRKKVKIDLALQGGGSHGAFTWGVLDRLLEEDWLEIAGVSGTSAGAMNAGALVSGLACGGREHARQELTDFWAKVSAAAAFSPVQRTPLDIFYSGWRLDSSPLYKMAELWTQFLSPYEFNPFNINPLKEIVEDCFDFKAINGPDAPTLFQSASNVLSGQLEVFSQPEISVETTMASACLPSLYQAVEIGDQAYWDGGYMGNPPLYPLARDTEAKDLILVQINPFRRDEVPKRVADINNRLNEMIFNSSLLNELRAAGMFYGILQEENVQLEGFGNGRLHRIADEETMRELSVSSKMNASSDFLTFLFSKGRDAAQAWLETDGKELGKSTTWLPDVIVKQLQGVKAAE